MKAAEGTMDLIINTVSATHQGWMSMASYFISQIFKLDCLNYTGVYLSPIARLEGKDNPTWFGNGATRGIFSVARSMWF